MNILFEMTTSNLMFIGIFVLGIVLFAGIIYYVLNKGTTVKPIEEDERYDSEEYFEEIKPKTKEQQEAKDELERVFHLMARDLEEEKPKTIVEKFEQEQEENAIISYQELIKQAEAKRNNPNKDFEEIEEIKEPKKFKNSEIISPIFGVQNAEEYKKQKQKNEELEVGYDNNNIDFLNSLKEFRQNL